jgi:hypothetical protein
MGEIVKLTPEEQAEIDLNAGGRQAIKDLKGIQTNKISGTLTDLELHYLEVMGQYAVSKYLGVPMDWSICVGGNKNPHFTVNGITMRVQTPTHHPPVLKLNRVEDFYTDLMVVCMEWPGEPGVIAIYGCVSRDRFLREHMLKDFGYGKRLTLMSWDLTPIADYQIEAAPVEKKPAVMETGPGSQQAKKDVG